jgi:hypothetical protein
MADSLESQRDAHGYPILTVPPEIISEIFLNFLPIYPECPPNFGIYSPLLLCRICRQWREIAVSTPTLWRAIRMDVLRITSDENLRAQLQLLETWLSRSGECPISLRLSGTKFWASPFLPRILHAVLRHCRQWEHVELCVPFDHLYRIRGDMPLLRYLKLDTDSLPLRNPPMTLFNRAPQLKDVVLGVWDPSFMHLPWQQLTHLSTRYFFLAECVDVIRTAVNLVRCTFGICYFHEPISIPVLPVHRHLRSLILRVGEGHDPDDRVWQLLNNLTLPALRTFEVYESGVTVDTLKDLISRSQCTLEELDINRSSMQIAYREALPSIGTITVRR